MGFLIKDIEPQDNKAAARIIRSVLAEFGCTGSGFACCDPETDDLYSAYSDDKARFWVIINDETSEIVGCGGFSQLKNSNPDEKICELQKFYLAPEARGHGFGKQILKMAIEEAKICGYRSMYLESVPQLEKAVALYKKFGFEMINHPLGDTGHNKNCSIFMLLRL